MRARLLVFICCFLGLSVSVQAAPLNLTLNDHPDVTANYLDLAYVADNSPNNFSVSGYVTAMDDDGFGPLLSPDSLDPGSYQIMASVTTAGVATGGTLTITGNFTSTIGLSGVLLTAALTDFGFNSPPSGLDLFEFEFVVTGGLMATSQYFGLPGSPVGVIYDSVEDLFANNATAFQSSFASAPFGLGWLNSRSDSAPIPEPGTLSLMVMALLPWGRRGRRKCR